MNASDYGVSPPFPLRQDWNLDCWGCTFSGDSYLCSPCVSKVARGGPLGLPCNGKQACDVCVCTSAATTTRGSYSFHKSIRANLPGGGTCTIRLRMLELLEWDGSELGNACAARLRHDTCEVSSEAGLRTCRFFGLSCWV